MLIDIISFPIFRGEFVRSNQRMPPTPYNLIPCKGLKNVFISRTFANFALHHDVSQRFRLWLSFTEVPDESYFQSLSRIQRIEIVNSDYKVTLDTKNYQENEMYLPGLCPRFSNMANRLQNYSCTGIFVRSLCHLSFQDLKDFLKRNQLKNGDQHCYIGNKFDIDVDVKPIQYLAQLFSSFQIEENLKFFKRFPFH